MRAAVITDDGYSHSARFTLFIETTETSAAQKHAPTMHTNGFKQTEIYVAVTAWKAAEQQSQVTYSKR